jgi:hypothetical protein
LQWQADSPDGVLVRGVQHTADGEEEEVYAENFEDGPGGTRFEPDTGRFYDIEVMPVVNGEPIEERKEAFESFPYPAIPSIDTPDSCRDSTIVTLGFRGAEPVEATILRDLSSGDPLFEGTVTEDSLDYAYEIGETHLLFVTPIIEGEAVEALSSVHTLGLDEGFFIRPPPGGVEGEECCREDACAGELTCRADGTCKSCGGVGERCCESGSPCEGSIDCVGGTCQACGNPDWTPLITVGNAYPEPREIMAGVGNQTLNNTVVAPTLAPPVPFCAAINCFFEDLGHPTSSADSESQFEPDVRLFSPQCLSARDENNCCESGGKLWSTSPLQEGDPANARIAYRYRMTDRCGRDAGYTDWFYFNICTQSLCGFTTNCF